MAVVGISRWAQGWRVCAQTLAASIVLMSGTVASVQAAATAVAVEQIDKFQSDQGGKGGRTELLQAADGYWYGVTLGGVGEYLHGSFFKINDKGHAQMLAAFPSDDKFGGQPGSSPVQGADGAFYGTTQLGGPKNYGTIYRFDKKSKTMTTLHAFEAVQPFAMVSETWLTLGTGGWLYGISKWDGSADMGMIFRIKIDGSGYEMLHSFTGTDGANPSAAMMLSKDGSFYGTTRNGGNGNVGVIYRFNPADNSYLVLNNMYVGGDFDPALSTGALVEDAEGNLYGTSEYGGGIGDGTLFKRASDGTMTTLHSFQRHGKHPYGPSSKLTWSADGKKLFGVTRWGGHGKNFGTIFVLNPKKATMNVLYNFGLESGQDGRYPWGGLTLGTDGAFYGMTAGGGGKYDPGTVYRVVPQP